jgi:hypothetical protein
MIKMTVGLVLGALLGVAVLGDAALGVTIGCAAWASAIAVLGR